MCMRNAAREMPSSGFASIFFRKEAAWIGGHIASLTPFGEGSSA